MTATQTQTATPAELKQLARAIDHTKLTFGDGENETQAIETLCKEAVENNFYAVCVRPHHVGLSKKQLAKSAVKVATVIGFPKSKIELEAERKQPTVGNFSTADKLSETRQALKDGADEFDLVLNVAQFKNENGLPYEKTMAELHAIHEAAQGRPVKVIIETDLLTDEEIESATRLCVKAGVAMVKTSTGMVAGGKGATPEAVALIKKTIESLNAATQIKASGGVKTQRQALDYLQQGVARLGTSSGVSLVHAGESTTDY